MQIIIKRGGRISLLFYFAHNCAHLRTISHHFLHIKLYDVIRKSIVFIQDVELNPVALRSADRDRREYAYKAL